MTIGRFSLGLLLVVVTIGVLVLAAGRLRQRLVPDSHGAEPAIIDSILVLSALTVSSEVLGTLGLFALAPVVGLNMGMGLAIYWFCAPPLPANPARDGNDLPLVRHPGRRSAALAGVVVLGSWMGRVVGALRSGMTSIDTLWYHLPAALHFNQTGQTTEVLVHDSDSITSFYPLTSSLLHGVLLMMTDHDLLSVFVALGWLALAVVAAFQIGRQRGRGPLAAMMALIILGTPALAETQPGSALTDAAGISLILAAAALGFGGRFGALSSGRLGLAGLSLGLATGMKFSFLAPVGLMALMLMAFSPRGRRLRAFGLVTAMALVTGSYWFVRNLAHVGSPLPTLELDIGRFSLPHVPSSFPYPLQHPIATFTSGPAARSHLVPGLRDAFGPLWWLLIGAALTGMVVSGLLLRRDRQVAGLGVVALGSSIAFLFTPQYLLGGTFWATTLRYSMPGLLLGLLAAVLLTPSRWSWLPLASLVAVVGTQLDPVVWSFGFGGESFFPAAIRSNALLGGAATVAAAIAALLMLRAASTSSLSRSSTYAASSITAIALLGGLLVLHGPYTNRRYVATEPFPAMYAWARDVRGAVVGVNGRIAVMKYPFAGLDRSNRVPYLSVRTPDGRVRDPTDCREWRRLLIDQQVDYVVVNQTSPDHPMYRWTEAVAGARLLLASGEGLSVARLYELPERIDPAC